MKKALVILPTFNEAGTIKELIEDILNQNKKTPNWEINILVNDSSSTDSTAKIIKNLQKKYSNKIYLLETKKEGLGKAYHQAFIYAIEHIKPFVIIQMDADYSHNPQDIPLFLDEIAKGADMVVGARYIKGGSIPKNWGLHRKILSFFANLIIRIGFMKLDVHEWTNGYRAIKIWLIKEALDHIKNYSGYVFQIAMLDFAIKKGAKTTEIPNNFIDRKYGKSKIFISQYILQIFLYILLFSSFIRFVIVGLIGFGIDFGISYFGIDILHKPIWLITIISTESAIISNFILNNFWSFSHKKIKGLSRSFIFGFLKFNLVSSGSIAIQTLGMQLLVNIFGRNLWYFYKILIIIFIIIPYSYILYNKIIWKNK